MAIVFLRIPTVGLLAAVFLTAARAATVTECGVFEEVGDCVIFQPFSRISSLAVDEVPAGVDPHEAVLVTGSTTSVLSCFSDSSLTVGFVAECEIVDFGCGELLPNPDMECQVWRGPEGLRILFDIGGFEPGDSVRVEGIPFPRCFTVCDPWDADMCVWDLRAAVCSDTLVPVMSKSWGVLKRRWAK